VVCSFRAGIPERARLVKPSWRRVGRCKGLLAAPVVNSVVRRDLHEASISNEHFGRVFQPWRWRRPGDWIGVKIALDDLTANRKPRDQLRAAISPSMQMKLLGTSPHRVLVEADRQSSGRRKRSSDTNGTSRFLFFMHTWDMVHVAMHASPNNYIVGNSYSVLHI
jgi:hypothetical protein